MDLEPEPVDDQMDYVSDSNTESSQSDYELNSGDESEDADIVSLDNDADDTVPDIDITPPSWTDKVEPITVLQFWFKRGPTLPDDFNLNTTQPIDYFKLFFTDRLIEHIVKCTNDYAHIAINKIHRTKPAYVDPLWSLDGSDDITCEELLAYLGCCVILSVNLSGQLHHIFSSEPYIKNMGIHQIFTLCQFMKISNFLCISVKSLEPPCDSESYDKVCKICPIVEHRDKLFPKYFHYSSHIILDKTMVTMKSRDHCQMYCLAKPSKWGWKVWSLCNGEDIDKPYLLAFSPYLGKKYTKVSKYGLYFDVMKEMTKSMRESNVKLYTDSAYSSVRNLLYVKKHLIFATCTVHHKSKGLHPSVKNAPKNANGGPTRYFKMRMIGFSHVVCGLILNL